MKQKFPKFSFVHVDKKLCISMSHFDKDFDAIIKGTYFQLCGGGTGEKKDYSLYQIKKGKIVDEICWYKEEQLTALKDQDTLKALSMIEDWEESLEIEDE